MNEDAKLTYSMMSDLQHPPDAEVCETTWFYRFPHDTVFCELFVSL